MKYRIRFYLKSGSRLSYQTMYVTALDEDDAKRAAREIVADQYNDEISSFKEIHAMIYGLKF